MINLKELKYQIVWSENGNLDDLSIGYHKPENERVGNNIFKIKYTKEAKTLNYDELTSLLYAATVDQGLCYNKTKIAGFDSDNNLKLVTRFNVGEDKTLEDNCYGLIHGKELEKFQKHYAP